MKILKKSQITVNRSIGRWEIIIGCTKKLQDEIGIIAKSENEEKDLFSWSANVIKVNRRKTVVVVPKGSRRNMFF